MDRRLALVLLHDLRDDSRAKLHLCGDRGLARAEMLLAASRRDMKRHQLLLHMRWLDDDVVPRLGLALQ